MAKGYIKLYRQIWDNPIVTKDADHLAVWLYLLTHAVDMPKDTYFDGDLVTLIPGQLITGRKRIAKDTHVQESKVFRVLRLFVEQRLISQETTPHGQVITIKSWDIYQR